MTTAETSAERALRWRVIIICALVAFFDGFDTQALGPAARSIAETLSFPVSALGPVFSGSQIGFLIGALTFGALGDRWGRKKILLACVALFSLCSLGTALAPNYEILWVMRLLAGLGLGGATPNFVSMASERALEANRARIVTMMWAAVPLGGFAAATLTAALLPETGWRTVFYIGFVAPVALLVVALFALPESREVTDRSQPAPNPAPALFGEGRAMTTVWLWLASATGWLTLIVVVFWTPALLAQAGFSASQAASVLAFHNIGGITGTLVVGSLIGRLTPKQALTIALSASGVAVIVMGLTLGSPPLVMAAAIGAGFFGSASAAALIAVSSSLYPGSVRATGVGFALGAGRVGTIVGPMLVGALVAAAWPPQHIYFAVAVPAFAALIFVWLLARSRPTGL